MDNPSCSEPSADLCVVQSPLEQALVKAWLGAYGGMILALFGGVIGRELFAWPEPSAGQAAAVAVATAFLVLYNSSLVLASPRWARILRLLPLACVMFVAMCCMVTMAAVMLVGFYYLQSGLWH